MCDCVNPDYEFRQTTLSNSFSNLAYRWLVLWRVLRHVVHMQWSCGLVDGSIFIFPRSSNQSSRRSKAALDLLHDVSPVLPATWIKARVDDLAMQTNHFKHWKISIGSNGSNLPATYRINMNHVSGAGIYSRAKTGHLKLPFSILHQYSTVMVLVLPLTSFKKLYSTPQTLLLRAFWDRLSLASLYHSNDGSKKKVRRNFKGGFWNWTRVLYYPHTCLSWSLLSVVCLFWKARIRPWLVLRSLTTYLSIQ